MLSLLDDDRRSRLRHEVDELLFLWMVGVETAWRKAENAAGQLRPAPTPAFFRMPFWCVIGPSPSPRPEDRGWP